MKRALLLLSLVGCGHPAPRPAAPVAAPAATSVTLPAPVPVLGPYVRFEKTQHEKLVVKGIAIEDLDKMTTDECVVAVEGNAIKELAVTFVSGSFSTKAGEPIGDHQADLTGRTFHEVFADGAPRFTEHGEPVADREVDLALTGYQRGDVGRPYWLGAILYDRKFDVGKPIELTDVRIGDTMTAKTVTAVLAKLAGGKATFEIKATFAPDSPLDVFDSVVVVDVATSRIEKLDNSLGQHGEVSQTFAWKPAAPATKCPD